MRLNTEDEDDSLTSRIGGFYNESLPNPSKGTKGVDKSWMTGELHKVFIRIISKHNDIKWLKKSDHSYCIYYCCHMLGTLTCLGESAALEMLREPQCIESLLSLWNILHFNKATGSVTAKPAEKIGHGWFEARCAARTISNFLSTTPEAKYMFASVAQDLDINMAYVALVQYAHGVDYTTRRWAVAPNRVARYVQNLMLKFRDLLDPFSTDDEVYDSEMLTDFILESAQTWKNYNATILAALSFAHEHETLSEDPRMDQILAWWEKCDIKLIEQACNLDLCCLWPPSPARAPNNPMAAMFGMDSNTLLTSGGDDFMFALTHLAQFEQVARKIASSETLLHCFVLLLHSRSSHTLVNRYDMILCSLLRFQLIPDSIMHDFTRSLVMLLEIDRSYAKICVSKSHAEYLHDTVVRSLKLIFCIPEIFEFVRKIVAPTDSNTTLQDAAQQTEVQEEGVQEMPSKFCCTACGKLLSSPQKLACCNHSYCGGCLVKMMSNDDCTGKCIAKKCQKQGRTFKSASYNLKLANQIFSSQFKITFPRARVNKEAHTPVLETRGGSDKVSFVGTLQQCWEFIGHNLLLAKNTQKLKKYFDSFCDFMAQDSVRFGKFSNLRALRKKALEAKTKGNQYFKAKQYRKAIEQYQSGLKILPSNHFKDDRMTLFSNMALNYMKLNDYQSAYHSALSGLAYNPTHLKLTHTLSKCYEVLTTSQLYSSLNVDSVYNRRLRTLSDKMLELNIFKMHTKHLFDVYTCLSTSYLSLKMKEKFNITNEDDEHKQVNKWIAGMGTERGMKDISEMMQSFEDEFARSIKSKITQYGNELKYCKVCLDEYRTEYYKNYLSNRTLAKRQIYKLILMLVSQKSSEWVTVASIWRSIRNTFVLEEQLKRLKKRERELLVSGYNRLHSRSSMTTKIALIPSVVDDLIFDYVFLKPKSSHYNITAAGLCRLVRQSKFLQLSDAPVTGQNKKRKMFYGVKLDMDLREIGNHVKLNGVVRKSFDAAWDWETIDFESNDSGLEDFSSNVNICKAYV